MSHGETRALLPKAGGARAPLPRASDVGVTADASAEKKPRSRWHVTAAGLLAPCAAALVVLVCAIAGTSGRASDAVSVRARLGTEADDFFHTQFHSENVPFSSDASAGLGLKTHRRGAEAEKDAEKDVEGVARNSLKPAEGKKASEKARATAGSEDRYLEVSTHSALVESSNRRLDFLVRSYKNVSIEMRDADCCSRRARMS